MTFAPGPHPAPQHLPTSLRRGSNVGTILGFVGCGILALASLLVIGFFALQFGPATGPVLLIGGFLALFPLAFVVWAVLAIDRWEPEPRVALWFSALWGGIAAVLLTLGVNTFILEPLFVAPLFSQPGFVQLAIEILQPMFPAVVDAQALYDFYASVIQAPIMEELWKAIPILVMFFFVRKHFDGPVDGVVIGALSAAGFAYTENILYFGRTLVETGDASFVFFLRGVMSPLTHAIFTAVGSGVALGIAARFSNRAWGVLLFPAGWALSAVLHAIWNGAGFWVPLGMAGYFLYYALVQVPICLAAVLLVVMLRRFESRITRVRLQEYSGAGWFSPEEVERLATSDGRAALMGWARQRGLKRAMDTYIRLVTRLAANRQRAVKGRDKLRPVADEAELLGDVASLRRHMATTAAGAPVLVAPGAMLPAPVASEWQPTPFGSVDPWRPRR